MGNLCAIKFKYTTETNKTGNVVFLVFFQISFVYPPLLNIELSTDGWRKMYNTLLFLLWIQYVVCALKFEYTTEINKTGTVVLLISFQIFFVYTTLLYIELSTDGLR